MSAAFTERADPVARALTIAVLVLLTVNLAMTTYLFIFVRRLIVSQLPG